VLDTPSSKTVLLPKQEATPLASSTQERGLFVIAIRSE
jgi:hypothetical protein